MAPSRDSLALNETLTSIFALLAKFTESVHPARDLTSIPSATTPPNHDTSPDPLRIVSDAAKLAKAHTTKLSLLATNKPFTPSAVVKVLKEFSGTCLPALMSAVQIFAQEKERWSRVMVKEVQTCVWQVFKEVETLLREVQAIAGGDSRLGGGVGGGRRDALSSTGVVWESCDSLIELEKMGIAGLAVKKAEEWNSTLNDAIRELQEWKDGEDLESEGRGDELLDSDDEGVDGDNDSLEDIFNAAHSMPRDRPEFTALVEGAISKIRKVAILYTAVIKRRIAGFPSADADGSTTARLDSLMLHLKRMPHHVDALTECFYELEEEDAQKVLAKCMDEAKSACVVMDTDWAGREDTFSAWLKKWVEAVG